MTGRATRRLPGWLVLAVAVLAAGATLAGCADSGAGTRITGEVSAPSRDLPDLPPSDVAPALDPCPPSRRDTSPVPGGLPDLELPCLGRGPDVALPGLSGRPRLVTIWASWCAPCRDELPWWQGVSDAGVAVLGVDAEDDPAAAAALLAGLDVTFPSVYDPGNTVAEALGVPGKPLTLFVASDGTVVHTQVGAFASREAALAAVSTYLEAAGP